MSSKRKGRNNLKTSPDVKASMSSNTRTGLTSLSNDLSQQLLNIFTNAFSAGFNSNLANLIQEVKSHLYNRDFLAAFGRDDLLIAYAIRWSPSRALAYANIFRNLPDPVAGLLPHSLANIEGARAQNVSTRIICIGAGAGAELVALAGHLNSTSQSHSCKEDEAVATRASERSIVEVRCIDMADWSSVTSRLYSMLLTAPPLSQYASTRAKDSNTPFVDVATFELNFLKQDVLNWEAADAAPIFTDATLVTLMFTLNELYSSSISATTKFLLMLTTICSPGVLLLVVDSPGSYSTVKLGPEDTHDQRKNSKIYPMQWLLDHTLLESASVGCKDDVSKEGTAQWAKLEGRDSVWFRLPTELCYPVELEDMRYQLHLYRRL